MEGMMSDAQMSSLGAVSGPAFDALWLQLMIEHHQGAVNMASWLAGIGSNPDLVELARSIVVGQQAEIVEMQTLLAK